MIAISKEEKRIIEEKFSNVRVTRTAKQHSKRHHYYCEERSDVMKFLRSMREKNTSERTE